MRMMIVVLIAIGMMAGLPAGVAAQSEEGLVAEWHFDEGVGTIVKDSSGNGNDGTIYGATWVDGKFGKALSFDGVDDYIEVPDSPQLSGGRKDLTVEAWIKIDSLSSSTIIGKNKDTSWKDWGLAIVNNKLYFQYEYNANNFEYFFGNSVLSTNIWYQVAFVYSYSDRKTIFYFNGKNDGIVTLPTDLPDTDTPVQIGRVGGSYGSIMHFNGIIDNIKIYNKALSAEEIKTHYEQGQTALIVKKEISPYSIRQDQTTNVTVQIKNTGTSDIRDIEVVDSTNSNLELIGGDFPNPKKYNSLSPGESRDIRYILKSKESGTFVLNPATVSYYDSTGNIKIVKSEPVSLTVVPSSEGSSEISSPSEIGSSSAVLLHGEKTDVVLGEDILLKLSAVNLITKPPMSVQVMIYPPSGMSVTGSEFVKSGAGIYTTTYTLNPGDGKDIEVHIKSNQVGDFNVKGRIVYYFGEDKEKAEDHTLNLPIKVRKEPVQTAPSSTDDAGTNAKTPGFEGMIASIAFLLVLFLKRNR